jgi:hypothetical protein
MPIAESRWLLSRTWGANNNLNVDQDIGQNIIQELITKGHKITSVTACNELMGHA